MKIERTVVNAKARKLSTTWTVEVPQAVEWIEIVNMSSEPVYKWKQHAEASLRLDWNTHPENADEYLDEVQAWCQATGNGRRTSYDTFHFSKPTKMTAFILRWNNG